MANTPGSRAFGIVVFAIGLLSAGAALHQLLTAPAHDSAAPAPAEPPLAEPASPTPSQQPRIIITRQAPITPGAPDATITRCPGGPREAAPDTPPQNWFTTDDYPPSALRRGQEGVVGIRYIIGPDGRIADCRVTQSSNVPALDQASCDLLFRRASFTPAHDSAGCPIPSRATRRIRWQIPQE
jgi:protein TonB